MKKTGNSGQVLVLFPFVAVFLFGLVLLVMDISAMVETRIQMQTAADAGARTGALYQAWLIDQISGLNTPLSGAYGIMTGSCACRWPPMRWTRPCAGWRGANSTARGLIRAQSALAHSVYALVPLFAEKYARANGASDASVENKTGLGLKLTRTFAISPGYDEAMNIACYDVVGTGRAAGLYLRDDISWSGGSIGRCRIRERVDLKVWKNGAPAYGSAILGPGLRYPTIVAKSSARPYWLGYILGDHDPRDDYLKGGTPFVNNNYLCMLQGRWDAKLVTYQKN